VGSGLVDLTDVGTLIREIGVNGGREVPRSLTVAVLSGWLLPYLKDFTCL